MNDEKLPWWDRPLSFWHFAVVMAIVFYGGVGIAILKSMHDHNLSIADRVIVIFVFVRLLRGKR